MILVSNFRFFHTVLKEHWFWRLPVLNFASSYTDFVGFLKPTLILSFYVVKPQDTLSFSTEDQQKTDFKMIDLDFIWIQIYIVRDILSSHLELLSIFLSSHRRHANCVPNYAITTYGQPLPTIKPTFQTKSWCKDLSKLFSWNDHFNFTP